MRQTLLAAGLIMLPMAVRAQQSPDSTIRCPRGAADEEATMVSAQVAATLRELNVAVDSALHDLGYRVSTAESGVEQWVTVPRRTWPAGAGQARWPADSNPGVQIIVDVSPDSAGLRLSVAASAVCLVGTMAASKRPGSPESAIETMSAMEVASEVLRRTAEEKR
jgi:hypothetical protein